MLRLLIQNGTNSGAQLQLEQGWLLLGRGEESALRFIEPSVSTRHAIISTERDEFFVLDQNSRNGTFLNGERVQTAQLKHGDVVECANPGTAWVKAYGAKDSPTCNYRYTEDGYYTVQSVTFWTVEWAGLGQSGTIPLALFSRNDIAMAEIQVLVQPG